MKQKFGTYKPRGSAKQGEPMAEMKKPVFKTSLKTAADPVNSPQHYASQGIECIDYIKQQLTPEEYRGYLLGNAHKYLHRHRYKGKLLEDLRKMQWYFLRYIKEYEEK